LRENVVIFAGARDPENAKDIHTLETKYPGKVYAVKLIADDEKSSRDAVETVKQKVGRLDVVIANAGAFDGFLAISYCFLDTPGSAFPIRIDQTMCGCRA
jgi:NADP-dependent 3-hydroxy acid dehydrogenase YdfG